MSSQQSQPITTNAPIYPNSIMDYTSNIFQSEAARSDGILSRDVTSILNGHCFYHEGMICDLFDYQLIEQLLNELKEYENTQDKGKGIINWNKHFKYDDPSFSSTFALLTQILGEYFDLNILATRLNIYTPTDWKTFHHDSHAYSLGQKEDFTVGLSLGSTRALAFLHPPTGAIFDFPQKNGDVFGFDSDVNKLFMHGVPKLNLSQHSKNDINNDHGPRLSIICWGKRRTLNERNCGRDYKEKELERIEKEENEKAQIWTKDNDDDEILFQSNNKKYANYIPPVKSDGGRPSSEPIDTTNQQNNTTTNTIHQANVNNTETTPGIPLEEVDLLMKQWIQRQLDKKSRGSQLKGLSQHKFKPLLNICLENFDRMRANEEKQLQQQQQQQQGGSNNNKQNKQTNDNNNTKLSTTALQTHSSLKQQSSYDANMIKISAQPTQYMTNQVLIGPRGLMIRVGATNKRFELNEKHSNNNNNNNANTSNNFKVIRPTSVSAPIINNDNNNQKNHFKKSTTNNSKHNNTNQSKQQPQQQQQSKQDHKPKQQGNKDKLKSTTSNNTDVNNQQSVPEDDIIIPDCDPTTTQSTISTTNQQQLQSQQHKSKQNKKSNNNNNNNNNNDTTTPE